MAANKEISKEEVFGFEQAFPEYAIVKRAILHTFYEADEYLKNYSNTGDDDHLVAFVSAVLSLYRKIRPKIPYIAKINKHSRKDKKRVAELWKNLYVLDKYLLSPIPKLIKESGSVEKQKLSNEIMGAYLLMSDALEELGVSKITAESISPDYALLEGAV